MTLISSKHCAFADRELSGGRWTLGVGRFLPQ
jgi:hypothetical protein